MEDGNNSTQNSDVVEHVIDPTEYFFVEGAEAVRAVMWNQAT